MPISKTRRGRPPLGNRARARTSFTLSPEAIYALGALSRSRKTSASRLVEELILARPLESGSVWGRLTLPKARLFAYLKKHDVEKAWLFGSVLRGDFGSQSDIDLLLSFKKSARISLFDLVDMKSELTGLLGRNVDLLEESSLSNPILRDEVLKTREEIYAA